MTSFLNNSETPEVGELDSPIDCVRINVLISEYGETRITIHRCLDLILKYIAEALSMYIPQVQNKIRWNEALLHFKI